MATESSRRRDTTLAKNTAALSVGRLASKMLVFLLVRFYTAVLTNEEFGTADLIANVANLLIPLACAGLSSGFFRFAAEAQSKKEQSDVFSAGVCILAVSSMLFALLSPLLFFVPYFGDHVLLILCYVLCANLHYLVSDFIRAQGKYRLFALQGLINTALNIAFNLIFLLPLSMGVSGYILSIVAADLVTSILIIAYCRLWRYVRPGAVRARQLRIMLRYCLPLIPASLCWWITNASDRYMVTYFCGEAANGLYAAAYKIPNLLIIACNIFADAWQFSAVVENRRAADAETSEQRLARRASLTAFFSKVLRGYSSILFIAAAAMMLLCKPIATLLLDPSFFEAWRFIPTLLIATVLSALSNFAGSVYMVERRGKATLVTAMLGAAVNVALNFVLIPSHGASGAAIATAVSYLAVLVARILTTRRSIPYNVRPVRLCLNALLLTAMAVMITLQLPSRIWICCALFALTLALNALPLLLSVRQWLREKRHTQAKADR